MSNELQIKPIAHIRTQFKEKFGIPRQSGRVKSLGGEIVFEPEFRNPDAIRGLDGFSHIWLIFDFSQSHREKWSPTVRPPRLGGNKRVGVFATRSPFRPNPLGLSCVKLNGIEHREGTGSVLLVSGVDLLDNTPIYDIKPYLPTADCVSDATGGFADAVNSHKLEICDCDNLLCGLPKEIRDCIADDPRPSYQDDADRVYSMAYAEYDVKFKVSNGVATIINVDKTKTDD